MPDEGKRKDLSRNPRMPRKAGRRSGMGHPLPRAVQGNFDHLQSSIREIADAHNLTVSDIEEIIAFLTGQVNPTTGLLGGADGAPGLEGPEGLPGMDGTIGKDGRDGTPGLDGSTGPRGSDGVPGMDGLQGTSGTPGLDGLDGSIGLTGATGSIGQTGAPGIDGLDGPPGPVWAPAPPEDNTLGVFRRDDGNNAQIEGVWLIDADPATEETDLTGGINFSVEFALGAGDSATSDRQGQTGWVVDSTWPDPDFWGVDHAPNTVLYLPEGVYAYQMVLIFDGASAVNLNEVFGGFEYAEDPEAISDFAIWATGPNYTPMQTAGDPTSRTSWLFTGIFVVPTGGAHYIFAFTQPTLGGTELRGYQLLLAKAQGAGATGDQGDQGVQGPQGVDGLDTPQPMTYKTLVFTSATQPSDGLQGPADYAAYNYSIQRVWGHTEANLGGPVTLDIEKNGVSLGWASAPTIPIGGGAGVEKAPTTASVTKGDKVQAKFTGTASDEEKVVVKMRVVAT